MSSEYPDNNERIMLPESISSFNDLQLPERIKTVMLDLDNTCYEYDPCHEAALTAVQAHLATLEPYTATAGVPDFLTRYKVAQKRVKSRIPDHAASHSRVLYFQALLEDLGDAHIYERCVALEQKYWSVFMEHMIPTPGLIEFLARCAERGTKVVVISDLTTSLQCQKLVALGMAPYTTALVTSEEAGVEKPDPRPFQYGLAKVGGTSSDAVMIGDNPAKDIAGADELGISAILFTHASTPPDILLRQDGRV